MLEKHVARAPNSSTIENAIRWLKQKETGGFWRIPVISSCLESTVLSLTVVEDARKRERIFDYLLENEFWKKSFVVPTFFMNALEEDEILREEVKEKLTKKTEGAFLRKSFTGKSIAAKSLLRAYYLSLFKTSPKFTWSSRTSVFYDNLPHVAPLIYSKKATEINRRLEEELIRGMNKDGSYAGNTIQTIKSAYILKKLGNEYYTKKAIRWLDKVYNNDGSFRPILYQDVYDTLWAALALSNLNENIESTLTWLESVRVEVGYPYYSFSYYPDPDDTSLALLLRKNLNLIDKRDDASIEFLLKSQNRDGGWSFLPFSYLSSYSFLRVLKPLLQIVGANERARKANPHVLTMWQRSFQSTVDMTSRVINTLVSFREKLNVKHALFKGISFLTSHYSEGSFHAPLRWLDSDAYENSLALIALHRMGINCEKILKVQELNAPLERVENVSHILWSLLECGASKKHCQKYIDFIEAKQSNDGSWKAETPFFSGSAKFCSQVFSTSLSLFVLSLISRN